MWGVTCAGTVAGLDCRALQSLPMTNTGQASVAVRIPPETKKPTMLILVPLSVYLPAGVSLKFGDGEAKTVRFDNCDVAGCLAKYDVTEAELGAMAKGQALTLSVQDTNCRPDQPSGAEQRFRGGIRKNQIVATAKTLASSRRGRQLS